MALLKYYPTCYIKINKVNLQIIKEKSTDNYIYFLQNLHFYNTKFYQLD